MAMQQLSELTEFKNQLENASTYNEVIALAKVILK